MKESITICCDVSCRVRLECAKFTRALEVNSGRIRSGYVEVKCENGSEYEK